MKIVSTNSRAEPTVDAESVALYRTPQQRLQALLKIQRSNLLVVERRILSGTARDSAINLSIALRINEIIAADLEIAS